MSTRTEYGQYCPLAISAGILCNRWTMLVLRELLRGSSSFNQISRGVPRMSRTLLSERLKELTEVGILVHEERQPGQPRYVLTPAGEALRPIVRSIAEWGQEWLEIEPSLDNLDVRFLMWDIHKNAKPLPELPDPFVVHILLTDMPDAKCHQWLIFEGSEVELSYVLPKRKPDVEIEVSAPKLAKLWMGWESFVDAVADGDLQLRGPKVYLDTAETWLGKSRVAHIKKRPLEQRVF